MKKCIILILSIIVALSSLCACGASSGTSQPPSGEVITSTETTVAAPVEQVIFESEQASFILTSNPYEDGFWGQLIDVRLENKTNTSLMFSLDKVSINGYMVNVLFASDIAAGKKENTNITVFSNELENNKITTIETIEFELHIYDSETYDHDVVNQVYTINFTN